jgi:hypothetical protein
VDQRLVRDRHIAHCDPEALALYLFLITVADAQGLSFYADATVGRLLSLPPQRLEQAREALVGAGLIAYETPLYQVLALEPAVPTPSAQLPSTRGTGELRTMREILRQTLGSQT